MITERLTTLAAVKEWLGIPADQTQSDTGLVRVINAASQFIIGYLNRDGFSPRSYTENFRGTGKASQLLRNWPVLSVSSVDVGSSTFSASTFNGAQPGSGWVLSDPRMSNQSVELFGSSFWYRMPARIVYEAGYRNAEAVTVTAADSQPVTTVPWVPQQGQWVAGISVKEGDLVYTQVTSAADIPTHSYYIDDWGTYTFSVDDVDAELVVTYGFVPWDVSFAVTEIIGEWYRRKEHIGVLSKTLGGQETVTFSNADISNVAASALNQYRNVVPM